MKPNLVSPSCLEPSVDCLFPCVVISVMAAFQGRESKGETDPVFPALEQDGCPMRPLSMHPSPPWQPDFPQAPMALPANHTWATHRPRLCGLCSMPLILEPARSL